MGRRATQAVDGSSSRDLNRDRVKRQERGDAAARRVTITDVAHEAEVSVASVSNYLNHYPYMRPVTKQKIQAAIDDLGYSVNSSARNLRSGRTGLISLAIPDLRQPYFSELAENIIGVARGYGYGVLVQSTDEDRGREIEALRSMDLKITDGLILSPVQITNTDIERTAVDCPLVILGERVLNPPAPHVQLDNIAASGEVTRVLLSQGCRRIAVIGGSYRSNDTSSRTLRTRGYVQALMDAGRAVDPRYIRETKNWTSLDGARATKAMYDDGLRPDAIFALNDLLALGVVSQLREMGVDIPRQVRVVGFDNITQARYSIPSLTTIDPGKGEVARRAFASLLAQMSENHRGKATEITVPYTMIFRDSDPR